MKHPRTLGLGIVFALAACTPESPPASAPPARGPPPPTSPERARPFTASDALGKTDDPMVAFQPDGAAITVSTDDAKLHDALASGGDKFALAAGKHVQIKIVGSYAPKAPPLIGP